MHLGHQRLDIASNAGKETADDEHKENIERIRRVRFLVEGRERPTLAGHVSIREPFM